MFTIFTVNSHMIYMLPGIKFTAKRLSIFDIKILMTVHIFIEFSQVTFDPFLNRSMRLSW